jgi:omega-amidase
MRIICCQPDIIWEDKPANHRAVRAMLGAITIDPGSLILLPEMFATGFSMDIERIDDGRSRETQQFLADLARERRSHVIGGIVTRSDTGRGRNEAVVFGPDGGQVARYCKLHPFSFGGESKHYDAGRNVELFEWNGFTVAPLICYDLRFPEPFRAAVRRGANLFAVIASWPSPRHFHWTALLQARAIENQAYVAGVNRCGSDPRLIYNGGSVLFDPRGQLLMDAGDQPNLITTEPDLAMLQAWRAEFPVLNDMRTDL